MIRYAWLDIQVKKRKKNGSVVQTFFKNQPLVSRVLEQPQLKFTSYCTVGYIDILRLFWGELFQTTILGLPCH